MKKIISVLALAFVLAGCPEFEKPVSLDGVNILKDGVKPENLGVESGETITLKAEITPSLPDISIIWEISGTNVAIVSSGEGAECSIRGLIAGTTDTITVQAWKNSNEKPLTASIDISIVEPEVTDIIFTGTENIFVGEEQFLSASLVPDWASGKEIIWSAITTPPPILSVTGNTVTGERAGTASVTATAGGTSQSFAITVKALPALSSVAISGGAAISIGLYEEITLNAVTTPAADTWFIWESDSDAVSVDSNGVIKGLKAGETAEITLKAGSSSGDLTHSITVTVKNPVTGLNILYANDSSLPVSNIIWLSPGEEVSIKIDTPAAGGEPTSINWTANSSEVTVLPSANGKTCIVKGGAAPGYFEAPPAEIVITARNADNRGKEISAVIYAKVQNTPLWAWDRARDADKNEDLDDATLEVGNTNINYKLTGRGSHKPLAVPVRVFGNGVPYTEFGLKLNSSNNYSGKNPDPIGAPGNSTRITIGSVGIATEANAHQNGDFNFLEAFCTKQESDYILKPEAKDKMIRVSVDYEIIWTAGAGRDFWIMLNNNNANASQSVMGTDSQILIEPLIAARGTRATALTYIDVYDMVERQFKGIETLERAFIGLIALSNGGSIYVSGIRIEYE